MVIKSVPLDDMNVVVFAIRGSQTFMDWAVNLNSAPASPEGFLVRSISLVPCSSSSTDRHQDDTGNLCHSGFLSVARKMVKPVAARLRTLLKEDPSRASCSLLITGHSAGGAVASLLYAHMLAELKSELNLLTGCFKRVHCITFGTPPVSLLPLHKPATHKLRRSLFLSFINEGDPVPRADRAYVRSLLELFRRPPPSNTLPIPPLPQPLPVNSAKAKPRRPRPVKAASAPASARVVWKVPASTLSNAGQLVLLRRRGVDRAGQEQGVQACVTTDQQLRGVVFGDPVMHMMTLYERRIEMLATEAVLARGRR